MARGYTVATVALALGAPFKWVDNVLSHYSLEGVSQSRQGVARVIGFEAVFQLALLSNLSETLSVPVEAGIGGSLLLARTGEWRPGGGIIVRIDREEALENLRAQLAAAVEAAPLPRRGRPATKAKRGAD